MDNYAQKVGAYMIVALCILIVLLLLAVISLIAMSNILEKHKQNESALEEEVNSKKVALVDALYKSKQLEKQNTVLMSKAAELEALKKSSQSLQEYYTKESERQKAELARIGEDKTQIEKQIEELNAEKTAIEQTIQAITIELQQKQAEQHVVDSFVKSSFDNGLPYIDFNDYFNKNNFSIVLKMLEECIAVAPQFRTELKKIEWSLCYLPYKKQFIRELSVCGIYALEVKRELEQEVLDKLGLKRVNDKDSIVYIGQATNIYDRWTGHIKKMIGVESAGGEKLYMFKPETFVWRVLEVVDKDNLDERESYWIDWFKSNEVGLNSKKGNR